MPSESARPAAAPCWPVIAPYDPARPAFHTASGPVTQSTLPALLSFALYRGGGRYAVHFEPFADPVTAPAGTRRTATAAYARAYADRLAAYCRSAPYNWFNFYDFWGEDAAAPERETGGH